MSVWSVDPEWYLGRKDGHPDLWRYVERFVCKYNVKSMVEIGGGHGYASELVEQYTGIERSHRTVEDGRRRYPQHTFLHDDWITMDTAAIPRLADLILACAVVEHCESYEAFISRALSVSPGAIVVSFFRGLDRARNEFHKRTSADTEWSEAGGVYYDNFYSRNQLTQWLDELGCNWRLDQAGGDTILVIQ